MASTGRHRRRRRHTLPVPALAGSAAVAVAVAGSLTAPAGANGALVATDVAVLDAPSRPAATPSADPFGDITEASDALGKAATSASSKAHRTIRAEEIERARERAEARAAREKAARERLASLYTKPLDSYRLSAGYGVGGWMWSRGYHTGQDLTAPYGSPVRAVHSGTVTYAGWDGAYGYKVEITHPDGTQTWYAHMSSIAVPSGSVTTGQVIGAVGSTGNSFGPHLHLEVHSAGGGELNPYGWLQSKGVTL